MPSITHSEIIPHPVTGEPFPKMIVSEEAGSRLEWSMHDETIQAILPSDFWTPVFACSSKTLRQHIVDGWMVFLVGFGLDSDEAGRLLMIRHRIDPRMANDPKSKAHMLGAIGVIATMLAPHGFDPNKSMWDTVAGN